MSIDTKIIITCSRCGKKSTSNDYKNFCSKVNLPSVEHLNNFRTEILRHMDRTDIDFFEINIKINEHKDFCPECRSGIDCFFEEQADRIKKLLEKEK